VEVRERESAETIELRENLEEKEVRWALACWGLSLSLSSGLGEEELDSGGEVADWTRRRSACSKEGWTADAGSTVTLTSAPAVDDDPAC
jgi:hypothetical protein